MERQRSGRRWAIALLSTLPIMLTALPARAGPAGTSAGMSSTNDGDACVGYLAEPARATGQAIDSDKLARIRDIGTESDEFFKQSPLAVSPDGTTLAFSMRRGDPLRNRNCLGIFTLPLAPGSRPHLVATGGDDRLTRTEFAEVAVTTNGTILETEPRWSPDGRWIAFLKRTQGRTSLWKVAAGGGQPQVIASLDADIDDFAWGPDGSQMLVSSDPGLAAEQAAIDQEGRRGYLFDDRAFPMGSVRPFPLLGTQPVFEVVDLATEQRRPATAAEQGWLHAQANGAPADAHNVVAGPRGSLAWQTPAGNAALAATIGARVGGRTIICGEMACQGTLVGFWWSGDGHSLLLARRGAAEAGLTRFYKWTPLRRRVRLIGEEDARYVGCRDRGSLVLCLRDDPSSPFQIVSLNPSTGRHHLLFDPNPDISRQFRGRIERMVWSSPGGTPTFGHLILPPGYRAGQRLAMVVVQYRASGFQRGGVGDEAPILPLANDGFAVFNFDRPTLPGHYANADAYMQAAVRGWADERQTLAALEAGVHLLIDRGVADPDRIGLYGLSAGSQAGQFALLHSTLFKAISLGTCCRDPYAFMVETGPALRRMQAGWGLLPIESGNVAQWREVSPAMNAERIHTPLLLQLPESEYRSALATVTALMGLNRPVEMDVFPQEYHIKYQSAHRLALYQRNIDWFDFWLRDKRNDGQDKTEQYARWDQMRTQARARTP